MFILIVRTMNIFVSLRDGIFFDFGYLYEGFSLNTKHSPLILG